MRQLILLFSLVVACAEARTDRTIELHKVSEIADIEVLDQEVELGQLLESLLQPFPAPVAPVVAGIEHRVLRVGTIQQA